jgi:HlyD family secretion protein
MQRSTRGPVTLVGPVLAVTTILLLSDCSRNEATVYQGYVEGEFVDVSTSQAGQLLHLAVMRGQTVSIGAPLFQLESDNESAALKEGQRQLEAARAQLRDMKSGRRPPELDVIRQQLAQAEANDRQAADQLARDEPLAAINAISHQQLEESRAQAQTAAAHVHELRSQLAAAELPGRGEQIRAQQAQAQAAAAAVDQDQWRLDQKTVSAPRAGLVYDTLYREGEWVGAGMPVVRMLPPENIKVRFFVPESLVGALQPGREVSIHCDGCGADVAARITYVAAEAEYTPPVIYSNENRAKLVFLIEARSAPEAATALHPGQPVAVRLR